MKSTVIVLLSSALVLVGGAPSRSQTAPSPAASTDVPTGTVARDGYLQNVNLQMAEWRAKLADVGASASGATATAGKDAETDISEAWARVESAADRLDAAGAAGWGDAKAAYERAAEDLDKAWAKLKPAKT
jgi:hypothetical protein